MTGGVVVAVLGFRARAHLETGSLAQIVDAAGRIRGAGPIHVVYLDNYSRDGSVQIVARDHTDCDLLVSPINTLYCRGVNTLIQYGWYRYKPDGFLLVDADNDVEPDCFAALQEASACRPKHAMLQPLVRQTSDPARLYSCGHRYDDTHQCWPMTELPDDPQTLEDLPSCSIACTYVRSDAMRRTGLLNPVFDIYWESSDLAFRARAAGYRVSCIPQAVAYNEPTYVPGLDSMHNFYYINRNRLLFWRLHNPQVFSAVTRVARARLEELEAALEQTEFGLDAEREALRRGLSDGLVMACDTALMAQTPPRLDAFDKTNSILVQTGRDLAS